MIVVVGVVLAVLLVVSLRVRRNGEAVTPDPSWQPTADVFRDPRRTASCGCGSTVRTEPGATFLIDEDNHCGNVVHTRHTGEDGELAGWSRPGVDLVEESRDSAGQGAG